MRKEFKKIQLQSGVFNMELKESPIKESLQVFLNGVLLYEGKKEQYIISDRTITFVKDLFKCDYLFCSSGKYGSKTDNLVIYYQEK